MVSLNYIAGNDRDFMCWFHIQDMYIVFGATFRFTGVKNTSGTALKEATVSTMGTYFCEIDDAPSSTERWVGNIKYNGFMVPESQVPAVLQDKF